MPLKRYFPSEIHGNKWPKKVVFHLNKPFRNYVSSLEVGHRLIDINKLGFDVALHQNVTEKSAFWGKNNVCYLLQCFIWPSIVPVYMMHVVSEYVLPTLWLRKYIWKAVQLMRMSAAGTKVWAKHRKCPGFFYTFLYITMLMTDWVIYWQLMASENGNGWHMTYTAHL